MSTLCGIGEELVKLTVTFPALEVASSLVKAREPLGSASKSRVEAPAVPPSASSLASPALSSTSSLASPAFSSTSSAAPPVGDVSPLDELSEPQAASARAARSRANSGTSFFIWVLSRGKLVRGNLAVIRIGPLPGSATVELGGAAAEEGLDPVAEVFGRHRVGDS